MKPTVLVVEDEFTIALELARIAVEAGFDVIGPVPDVASALALVETRPVAAAVLDANLKGESAEPIAQLLSMRQIPFMIVTGYAPRQLGDWSRGVPLLTKPCADADVITMLTGLIRRA